MSSVLDRAFRVASVAQVYADAVDRDARFPEEAVSQLKQERLLSLQITSDLGGEGLDLKHVAQSCCQIAQACSSTAMIFAMHHIQMTALARHSKCSIWHRNQMAEICSRQLLIASATSEAGLGGNIRRSKCAVESEGSFFSLTKSCPVISYGKHADLIFVTARRSCSSSESDQILAALSRDQYYLNPAGSWDTLGMRGTCSEGYKLNTSRVHKCQIFAEPFADIAAQSMLPSSHILWGSVWLGMASCAVERAKKFVQSQARQQADVNPTGNLQLAEAVRQLQVMESVLLSALEEYRQSHLDASNAKGISFGIEFNNVKISTSNMGISIVSLVLQIMGLAGYKNDSPYSVCRIYRDILSAPLMVSNDQVLTNNSKLLLLQKKSKRMLGD